MKKILNLILAIIVLIFTIFSFSGCNNSSTNLKLDAIYVYKSNKLEIQIELYSDYTLCYKYIPNSYNDPEYYKGTFSINEDALTIELTPDKENSENSIIKNGNKLIYTITSDTEFKDNHGRKIKYKSATEKIVSATILISKKNSNDSKIIYEQNIEQNKELINTYEDLINSKTIKKIVEKKYGSINNVELKAIEDSDLIKVIYVCDEHTDEDCKQILQELLSEFSSKIKEIYNEKEIYIIDSPEISSRTVKLYR